MRIANRAARRRRAAREPLVRVDHVVVAVALDAARDVGRVELDATHGSVIAKHERISPSSSGRSHCSCCSGVPNWARISMLPVSGAAQFVASGEQRRRAHDLAQRRVVEVREPGAVLGVGQEQVPEPAPCAPRPSAPPSPAGGSAGRPTPPPAAGANRRGRVDDAVDELRQVTPELVGAGAGREVHGDHPSSRVCARTLTAGRSKGSERQSLRSRRRCAAAGRSTPRAARPGPHRRAHGVVARVVRARPGGTHPALAVDQHDRGRALLPTSALDRDPDRRTRDSRAAENPRRNRSSPRCAVAGRRVPRKLQQLTRARRGEPDDRVTGDGARGQYCSRRRRVAAATEVAAVAGDDVAVVRDHHRARCRRPRARYRLASCIVAGS